MKQESPHGLTLIVASRIITQNGADVEAIVVAGDRVLASGSVEQMRSLAPKADRRDHVGATIVPGFNDAHQHLSMMAAQALGLDLSDPGLDNPAALAGAVRNHATSLSPGGWVVATRYDHMRSSGGRRLTRADLDELVPDRPAIVVHIGAHWGVANSAALAAGGLTDDDAGPAGGELGKDAAGRLNGFVSEQALFDFVYPSLASRVPIAPVPSLESLLGPVRASAEKLLAAGITSVCDAMVGPRELRLLQLARNHGLALRVNALLTFPHLPSLSAVGLRDGFGDEWLRIGGIKAFVDGAVAGRSCAVAQPFADGDDGADIGILTVTSGEVDELVERATAAGTRLAIHANGERAIEMVLDAFEQAARPAAAVLRHRIEHCSIITPEILARMRRLGVIAVPFGSYALFHGDKLVQWYGADRLERMFAHRSMLDAGITVAGSSDYPCGPYEPLLGLQSCVTRRSVSGTPIGPSQRVSLREALEIYTVGSAVASGEEHDKGRLAPGYLADFTVLEGDLTLTPPDEIGAVEVLETWVGGEPRWTSSR
jgi:predicted amidohydrolase YtcJ